MKKNLKMQPTETAVFHAASRIYSAYIVSGQVGDQEANAWMKRAIAEAIKMADATDQLVVSDDEIDSLGFWFSVLTMISLNANPIQISERWTDILVCDSSTPYHCCASP